MYYSQKDSRWATKKVGYGKLTFAQAGCALTAIANKLKFDGIEKTPLEINDIAKKCGAFNVDMLIFPVLAEALGYKYSKQIAKPTGRQIIETNYYAKVGVPQHFVFYNPENEKRIDSLDLEPSWEENNYPVVSYRVFTKALQSPAIPEKLSEQQVSTPAEIVPPSSSQEVIEPNIESVQQQIANIIIKETNMTQVAQSFDRKTVSKILKGAIIAAGSALLTYLLQAVSAIDFGAFTPIIVMLSGIAINTTKEYFSGIKI